MSIRGTHHNHLALGQTLLAHLFHRLVEVLEELGPLRRQIARRQLARAIEAQVPHVHGVGGARDDHRSRGLVVLLLFVRRALAALLAVLCVTRVSRALAPRLLTAAEDAGELGADRVEGVFDRGRQRHGLAALDQSRSAARGRTLSWACLPCPCCSSWWRQTGSGCDLSLATLRG